MAATTEVTRLDVIEKNTLEKILESDVLPKATVADNGKGILIVNGEWTIVTLATLPSVSSTDNGKALVVSSGKWTKANIATLPTVTPEDVGKVLTVDENGKWVAAIPE